MASGLLALLDDVAMIARTAAAALDDVAAASGRAAAKTAGVVIDDVAVAPRAVIGLAPARELPMIWRIARGSLRNKLLVLMPAFLLLAALAPWALTPLLMLGGLFLAFEAAGKALEALGLLAPHAPPDLAETLAPGARESRLVAGAIRTDLILSAEILAITLAALPALALWQQAAALASVSLLVTAGVYGLVALIVKMDDLGLRLARARSRALRRVGSGLVAGMPHILDALAVLGTLAMAWVGGGILLHGLGHLGLGGGLLETVEAWARAAGASASFFGPAVGWLVHALLAAAFGLAAGAAVAGALAAGRRLFAARMRP